ncbi:MAG: D-alanyl-D-alanine carboxypeptidase [Holosporales bacterium]|jgi:D-alanyl-D-alanine carboxypeptidase|nr:D-alanyl-D-alanine carboxypeptidase [Holosporales bacterium]
MRFLLFVLVLLSALLSYAAPPYGAIVIDATSGRTLHEKGADVLTQPASLTKMMTLFLTFKEIDRGHLKWNKTLKVSSYARQQSPSVLGVRPGQKLTVRQAVLALVTKSANDIAVTLAEGIAGSESSFVARMNKEARRLGMRSTIFRNASGLPNSQQVSTARDMARLSQAIMRECPQYYPLFSTRYFTYNGHTHANHNKLLGRTAGGVVIDGLKTGFVNASGFNLAASAIKGKRRLIVVVLGGPDRLWRDARVSYLFRCGFDGHFSHRVAPTYAVPHTRENTLQVLAEDDEIEKLIRSLSFSDSKKQSSFSLQKRRCKGKIKQKTTQHIVCVSVIKGRAETLLKRLQQKIPKNLLARASVHINPKHTQRKSAVEFICQNKKHAVTLQKILKKSGFRSVYHT